MKAQAIIKHHAFIPSLIGLALLGASPTASSQQPQEQDQVRGQEPAAAGSAQPQPAWSEVRIVHVKGDRIPEFEGLIKEFSAALSKRGGPAFEVWQVAFGDQDTYHIVSALQSFASIPAIEANPPMEPQAWASWISRIVGTIDSQELVAGQMHPELSIVPQGQQSAAVPDLLILVSQSLLPGKREGYVTWLRDDMMPALRKAGVQSVSSYEMAFGAESRQWVLAVPIESWAQLDQPMPLYTSMGQEAAEELLSKGDSMVERSATILLRSRSDLSAAGGQAGQQEPGQQQQR